LTNCMFIKILEINSHLAYLVNVKVRYQISTFAKENLF
jgi:hypothetical protein